VTAKENAGRLTQATRRIFPYPKRLLADAIDVRRSYIASAGCGQEVCRMSRYIDDLIDLLNRQGAARQELRRALREKRGGELPRSDKGALTLAYRKGGQASFVATWRRLMGRAQPRQPQPRAHASARPVARRATPRRRRCARPGLASSSGESAEPDPDPEPAFAWPLFAEPGDPPPLPEPDQIIMRVIRRSPLWAHVDPQVRAEILAIARHQPFGPSAAAAIDRRLELAALDADRHPQSWGDLWLPGMALPIGVLMVRNSWGFWRAHIDIADHTEWHCWGGRA
jgi:hypothetical protein